MRKYLFFILVLCSTIHLSAQDSTNPVPPQIQPDTAGLVPPVIRPVIRKPVVRRIDSTAIKDSIARMAQRPFVMPVNMNIDTLRFSLHPYFRFTNPTKLLVTVKQWKGKETIFYSIIALLLFFALIRNSFDRYIQDLFKIFFRTTVNQRQVKEQLLQSPLPSLLLNIFFLISLGMFIALMLQYYQLGQGYSFWLLFLYSMLGLIIVYGLKFISLKILGWIFQVTEASDAYIFIVFTTNKVIGMAILPFLVVLAFSYGLINQVAMNLAIIMIILLIAYRYFLSYATIHRQISVNLFHFLLYLCAFEIVPLLLINKLLFRLLGETS